MIRNLNGKPLTASDVSTLPEEYSGLFFVPSPSDVTTHQSTVRLYLIPKDGVRALIALPAMTVEDAEQECRVRCKLMIVTVCMEHDEERPENCLMSHIFVGDDVPDTTGYKRHRSDKLPTMIFTKTVQARRVNTFFPLSVTILDKSFHAQSLTSVDVSHLVHALGPRGSYQSRVIASSMGSISYIGRKSRESQSRPTPSEGPGMRQNYCYYRQHIDPKFVVSVLHCVNRLVQTTYRRGTQLLRVLGSMEQDKKLSKGICRIAIRSSDYCVTSHVDTNDAIRGNEKEHIMTDWRRSKQQQHLCRFERKRLSSAVSFAERYGLGVHTVCCYQFVEKEHAGQNDPSNKAKTHQLFVFPTLGVTRRMRDYETHAWMASSVQHATCVPIFEHTKLITFGHSKYVSVEAWGASKANKNR